MVTCIEKVNDDVRRMKRRARRPRASPALDGSKNERGPVEDGRSSARAVGQRSGVASEPVLERRPRSDDGERNGERRSFPSRPGEVTAPAVKTSGDPS